MSDPGTTRDRGDEASTHPLRNLLLVLGARIVAVLGGLVHSAHLGIGAVYIVLFSAVVIVLLRFVLWDPFAEWIRSARDQDTFGKILVESPEVYTRERLVNDRLRQTVWLRKQMRATEKVLKEGYFRSHEGQWAQDVAAMMSLNRARERGISRNGSDNTSDLPQNGAKASIEHENGNDGSPANQNETGTSIELFRAMNEYREQVRTELMQTQLDDRHDIDGNTLYRLNFNTTIVHGRRSDALAVVLVRLEHSENRNGPDERFPNNLLHDWAQELERRLNAVARSRVQPLRPTDPPERAADATDFYLWLRERICRKLTRIAASLPESGEGESSPSPGTIGVVRKRFKVEPGRCSEKSYQSVREGRNTPRGAATPYIPDKELGDQLDRFIGDYMDRYRTARRAQDLFLKYVEARPELVKEISSRLPTRGDDNGAHEDDGFVRNSLDFYRELGRRWCYIITSQRLHGEAMNGTTRFREPEDPERLKMMKRHERETSLVQLLCTPGRTSQPQQLVLDAVMDLYWRLQRLEEKLSFSATDGFSDSKRLDDVDCKETPKSQIEKALRNQSANDMRIPNESWRIEERKKMEELLDSDQGLDCMLEDRPELWRRNLAIQHESDEFNRKFIDGEVENGTSGGVLKGIVTVETVGCEAELCRIVVRPDTMSYDPAECFYRTLDKDLEVFSYGVTPKNWRQRLAFSGSVIRSTAVALETPALLGETGMIEGIRRNQEALRSVMSQPIVIGFGRDRTQNQLDSLQKWSEHKCDSISNETSVDNAEGKTDLNRETEFGWFIAPERRWGDGGGKWHPHRQYDLSAVISIPSWWRRVKLTISTCWQKLSELENLGDDYFDRCGREKNNGVDDGAGGGEENYHVIKLPGDVSEVSRKLRIEVRDVPYIITQMYSPRFGQYVFHAGKRADVVIEGGRLWRSTRVTMGTQPADEITVLPHMEGIVATFDCVRRPPFSAIPRYASRTTTPWGGHIYAVPLQVWTSEGVTTPPLPINIVEVDPDDDQRCLPRATSSQSRKTDLPKTNIRDSSQSTSPGPGDGDSSQSASHGPSDGEVSQSASGAPRGEPRQH